MVDWKKKFLSKEIEVKLERPVPDFIPYACHYNEHTLLTRNGELLQIIKVTGFSYEMVGGEAVDLRHIVRKAVRDNIWSTDYALWFHTVRRKKSLDPAGEFPFKYSRDLHEAWSNKHYWHDKYVNELYITVLHEGQSLAASVKKPQDFIKALSLKALEKRHNDYLDHSYALLNETVNNMLETLAQYGAKRLGIVVNQHGIFSEPLQFLGKIIHLEEVPKPLPIMDLAAYLATQPLAFGNTTIEVVGKTKKHFSGILSIKEYHEVPSNILDNFLQLPLEFIITQTLDFINSKKALSGFKYQDYILNVSGDEMLRKLSGMEGIMKNDTGSIADFGEQQLTIMVMEEDIKRLDLTMKQLVDELSQLGILAIREDLFLEDCFWSQLPGNFMFISRKSPIDTARIGGLASLHNFPAGKRFDNHWGRAITVFRTAIGTPYFFNFHHHDNGHTVIIGPAKSGKTVLMNFLVSEAMHLKPRVFFIDQRRAARVLVNTFSGTYTVTSPTSTNPPHQFNPLLLEDTPLNRQFLASWLEYLVTMRGDPASNEDREVINNALEVLYTLPKTERRLSKILHLFGTDESESVEGSLRERLEKWHGTGKYAKLFDNDNDDFPADQPIWGFGISQVISDPVFLLAPVVSYYLHRIRLLLDGTPTIIVIDHAWSVLDNKIFAPQLGELLDTMKQHNAMVILAAEVTANQAKSLVTKTITENVATQIFLPNPEAPEEYKKIFGLTEKEFSMLTSMSSLARNFMLKQGGDAIVGELNLIGMNNMLTVLAGSDDSSAVMEKVKSESGNAPEEWLPAFYDHYKK
jgi:type IV secretion system protein VirB4